ncbi:MAG TPA: helix-turn-helix domain-containing protein [Pirellulales bacterium]
MPPKPTLSPTFTVAEIAAAERVGSDTVLGWIQSGELVAHNAGRGRRLPRWRVRADDFERFLAARRAVREAAPVVKPKSRRPANVPSYV